MGIEGGFILSSANPDNLSLLFNIEPKVKVLDNTFVGLRFGVAINSGRFENNDITRFTIDDRFDHGVVAFMPTVDYYLSTFYFRENIYRPYVGVGIGYHLSSDIDVSRTVVIDPVEDTFDGSINARIGGLLRAGLESGKLRLGLEYHYLPPADLKILDNQVIGIANNSYLGLTIGFMIGGGQRWRG